MADTELIAAYRALAGEAYFLPQRRRNELGARELAEPRRKSLRMFDPALDYGLLPSLTGFALRRASLLDFSKFAEAVGDRAITPLRYSFLELVGVNPGLPQVQLAEILGLSKPAASLAIDFWQARKCISRRRDTTDRRTRGIYLTQLGEEKLDELRSAVARHDKSLTSALSNEELVTLRGLLERVFNAD